MAEAGDAVAIQAMLEDLARQDGAAMQGSADALLRHGFGARPLFRVVLAERAGQVIGLALFYPDFSTLRGSPGAFVQDLYIVPEARGSGLGAQLLAQVRASAQDWSATYLALMVDRLNADALRFYERRGFVPRGAYRNLILEGEGLAALGTA